MIETWLPVPNFPGYEISNLGRCRNKYKRILKKYINPGNGYVVRRLSCKGKWSQFYMHRLVAQLFIPNPDNLPQVNHKNGIKDDNRVENLEWCSVSNNAKHQWLLERKKRSCSKKKVRCVDLGITFASTQEAAEYFNVTRTRIYAAAKGLTKKSANHKFKFV